jgi:phosphoribosylanthranilate isomerase
MSLLIKVCGLKSAADVASAVDAGADAIGFVFAESPRRVTPEEARLAANTVGGKALRVAVMRHPASADWQHVLETFAPDVLQTDAEDFVGLEVPDSVQCWPVFRENGELPASLPQRFLYEGADSGRGLKVDWEAAARIAKRGNMILAGGLDAGNVGRAVRSVRPFGVDVSSAVESAPGVKDPDLVREFVQAARAAESST